MKRWIGRPNKEPLSHLLVSSRCCVVWLPGVLTLQCLSPWMSSVLPSTMESKILWLVFMDLFHAFSWIPFFSLRDRFYYAPFMK